MTKKRLFLTTAAASLAWRLLGFIAIGLRSRGGRVSVVIFGGVFMQRTYAGPVDIGPQGRGRSAVALTDGQSR